MHNQILATGTVLRNQNILNDVPGNFWARRKKMPPPNLDPKCTRKDAPDAAFINKWKFPRAVRRPCLVQGSLQSYVDACCSVLPGKFWKGEFLSENFQIAQCQALCQAHTECRYFTQISGDIFFLYNSCNVTEATPLVLLVQPIPAGKNAILTLAPRLFFWAVSPKTTPMDE